MANNRTKALYDYLKGQEAEGIGANADEFINILANPDNLKAVYDYASATGVKGIGNNADELYGILTDDGASKLEHAYTERRARSSAQQEEEREPGEGQYSPALAPYNLSPSSKNGKVNSHDMTVKEHLKEAKKQANKAKRRSMLEIMAEASSYTTPTGITPTSAPRAFTDELERMTKDYMLNKAVADNLENTILDIEDVSGETKLKFSRREWHDLLKVNTWDMGIADMMNALQIQDLQEKRANGTITTKEAQALALIEESNTLDAKYADEVSTRAELGAGLAKSAGFMIPFIINPASGLGKATTKKMTEKFGKDAVTAFANFQLRKGAKALAAEGVKKAGVKTAIIAGSRIGADALGAGLMTATTSQPRIVADAITAANNGTQGYDENGILRYGREEDNTTISNYYWREFGKNFIENESEMFGEYLPFLDVLDGLRKGKLKDGTLGSFRQTLLLPKKTLWSNTIRRFKERAKVSGFLGEFLEEEVGSLANGIMGYENITDRYLTDKNGQVELDKDGNPKKNPEYFWNWHKQWTTAASVALMTGTIKGIEVAGNARAIKNSRKEVKDLDKDAAAILGEDRWSGVRDMIQDSKTDELADVMMQIAEDDTYTPEQRDAIMDYTFKLLEYQQLNAIQEDEKNEISQHRKDAVDAYMKGYSLRQASGVRKLYTQYDALRKEFSPEMNERIRQLAMEGKDITSLEEYTGLSVEEAKKAEQLLLLETGIVGLHEGAQDRASEAADDAMRDIDPVSHMEDGRQVVTTAVLVDGTKQQAVYVLSYDDNTAVIVDDMGNKKQVGIKQLQEGSLQTAPIQVLYDAYRERYFDEESKQILWNSRHHEKTQQPQVGMAIYDDAAGKVMLVVDVDAQNGNVGLVEAEFSGENNALIPRKGMTPMYVATSTALYLQDQHYDRLDAEQNIDNVSQNEGENEDSSTEEIKQNDSETPEIKAESQNTISEEPTGEAPAEGAQETPQQNEVVNTEGAPEAGTPESPAGFTEFQAKYGDNTRRKVELGIRAAQTEMDKAGKELTELQDKYNNAVPGSKEETKLEKDIAKKQEEVAGIQQRLDMYNAYMQHMGPAEVTAQIEQTATPVQEETPAVPVTPVAEVKPEATNAMQEVEVPEAEQAEPQKPKRKRISKRTNAMPLSRVRSELGQNEDLMNFENYVRYALDGAKFIWKSDGIHKGLGDEIIASRGNKEGDRRRYIQWVANAEKGGRYPSETIHSIWNSLPEQFADMGYTDMDVRDIVLDAMQGYSTPSALLRSVYDNVIGAQQRAEEEYNQQEADRYAREQGFANYEEYTTFIELTKSGEYYENQLTDEEINEFYSIYGDEIRDEEDARGTGSGVQGVVSETAGQARADEGGSSLGNRGANSETGGNQRPEGSNKGSQPVLDENENGRQAVTADDVELNGQLYNIADLEQQFKSDIETTLSDNGIDAEIVGVKLIGSRIDGSPRTDSDLDLLVEYKGDYSEDALFNLLNGEAFEINGVKLDINPITEGKSGTIEQFLKRNTDYKKEGESGRYTLNDSQKEELRKFAKQYPFASIDDLLTFTGRAFNREEIAKENSEFVKELRKIQGDFIEQQRKRIDKTPEPNALAAAITSGDKAAQDKWNSDFDKVMDRMIPDDIHMLSHTLDVIKKKRKESNDANLKAALDIAIKKINSRVKELKKQAPESVSKDSRVRDFGSGITSYKTNNNLNDVFLNGRETGITFYDNNIYITSKNSSSLKNAANKYGYKYESGMRSLSYSGQVVIDFSDDTLEDALKKAVEIFKEVTPDYNSWPMVAIVNGTEVRYLAAGEYYGEDGMQGLAHGIKNNDAAAIKEAARRMSKLIPSHSYIIPMPSRTGKPSDGVMSLCEEICKIKPTLSIKDILRGKERGSVYEAKKNGQKVDLESLKMTETSSGSTIREVQGKVYIIDNVIASGSTAAAAINAIGGGKPVVVTLAVDSKAMNENARLSVSGTQETQKTLLPERNFSTEGLSREQINALDAFQLAKWARANRILGEELKDAEHLRRILDSYGFLSENIEVLDSREAGIAKLRELGDEKNAKWLEEHPKNKLNGFYLGGKVYLAFAENSRTLDYFRALSHEGTHAQNAEDRTGINAILDAVRNGTVTEEELHDIIRDITGVRNTEDDFYANHTGENLADELLAHVNEAGALGIPVEDITDNESLRTILNNYGTEQGTGSSDQWRKQRNLFNDFGSQVSGRFGRKAAEGRRTGVSGRSQRSGEKAGTARFSITVDGKSTEITPNESLQELHENAEKIRKIKSEVDVKSDFSKSKHELKTEYTSQKPLKRDGLNIAFSGGGFEKSYRAKGVFRQISSHLRKILKKAEIAYTEGDRLTGTHRTDGSVHPERRNVDSYVNYIGKATIDDIERYVRVTVMAQKGNDDNVHSTYVSEVEIYNQTSNDASGRIYNHTGRLVKGGVDYKLEDFFGLASLSAYKDTKESDSQNNNAKLSVTQRTDKEKQELFDAAKNKFGTTTDFREAGYLLPDGSLLDFSEKNNGGQPGTRNIDHRAVSEIMGGDYETRTDAMSDFVHSGAIRLMPEAASINLANMPTAKQTSTLQRFIRRYDGEVILEIDNQDGKSDAYAEYEEHTSPSRIINDISRYFNEGIRPEGNTYVCEDNTVVSYGPLFQGIEDIPVSRRDENGNTGESNRVQRKRVSGENTPVGLKLRTLQPGEFCSVERKYTENNYYSFTSRKNKISSYEDVAYIFKALQDAAVEHAFAVLVKDGKPTVIHLGMGGFDSANVDLRVIVPAVNGMNPDAIYMVHNHPSGGLTPSYQDRSLLRGFYDAFGDKVHPGIIIDTFKGEYCIFDRYADNNTEQMPEGSNKGSEVKVYSFDKQEYIKNNPTAVIRGADAVASFVTTQRLGVREKIGVLILGNNAQVNGNTYLQYNSIDGNAEAMAKEISDLTIRMGGTAAILYGNNLNLLDAGKVKDLMAKYNIKLLDAVNINNEVKGFPYYEYTSATDKGLMEANPVYRRLRDAGMADTETSETDNEESANARFSIVTDQKTIDWFDSQEKVTVYRAMTYDEATKYLGGPMSSEGLNSPGKGKVVVEKPTFGQLEQSEEHLDNAIWGEGDKWAHIRIKDDAGGNTSVAYNPYIHTSLQMLNDQFAKAWRRPNMVVVKCEILKSDADTKSVQIDEDTDNRPYTADGAKNSIGSTTEWNNGPVSKRFKKKPRTVVLTQYCRPIELVSMDEYAESVKKLLEDNEALEYGVPFSHVTPEQRDALYAAGVPITAPEGSGKNAKSMAAYNEWKGEHPTDPTGTDDDIYTMARKAKEARKNISSKKTQNTKLSTTFAEGGNKNEIHQRVSQTEYDEMPGTSKESGPDRYSEGNRKAQENARSLKESVLGKIGTAQDDAARQWAKEHGVWFDLSSSNFGIPFPSGDENDNYLSDDGYVYKINNLSHVGGSIARLLEQHEFFNELFPESQIELVGITGFENGASYVVGKQRFIADGVFATNEQIEEHLNELGYKKVGEGRFSNGEHTIKDLLPRNVIVDQNNGVFVIDAELADAKLSVSPAQDAEYMEAVESGDMDKAQRMVDEVAKANGYERLFYHGAKKGGGFTRFKDWQYFTENRAYADRYAQRDNPGSLYTVYANLGNVFDTRKPDAKRIFENAIGELGLSQLQESGLPDWTDGYDLSDYIDENGLDYDSIILDEGGDLVDGKPVSRGLTYVIRKSNQIKSAEPVTYDDNGNVIPLSHRFNEGNNDIRFSISANEDEDAMLSTGVSDIKSKYEKLVTDHRQREVWQDYAISLRSLQEAVSDKNHPIRDWENVYKAENRLTSVNRYEMDEYDDEFLQPMYKEHRKVVIEVIRKLRRQGMSRIAAYRKALETVDAYLISKHGLERNSVMLERDAKKRFDKDAKRRDFLQGRLDEGRTLSDEQMNELAALEGKLAFGIDGYKGSMRRDYSGLTSLYNEKDLDEAERLAKEAVDDFESNYSTGDMWNAIRNATRRQLEISEAGGRMSPATRQMIEDMFQYYIPLRGFKEDIAEDMYDYMGQQSIPFSPAVMTAKGRKSVADSPIATIANVGMSTILQANRNKVKLTMLRLAENHHTDLISVSQMAYHLNDNGEWEEYTPNIPDNATPEQAEEAYRKFKADLAQKMLTEPDKYKFGRELADIPYKVLGPQQKRQHEVIVYRDGVKYVMTVNGNPRAAQAVNGQLNPEANDHAFAQMTAATNRFLAANFTTRDPAFVLANLSRDGIYANSIVWLKESPRYAGLYNKNWGLTLAQIPGLLHRANTGTLDLNDETDRLFDEFLRNGGETGYANLTTVTNFGKAINKEIKAATRVGVIRGAGDFVDFMADGLDNFNRSAELVSRFAAYRTSRHVGRSISRSIDDAKEITVNFNTKGAGAVAAGEWKEGNYLHYISANLAQQGRNLYVFWNAGVQGMTNFGKAAKDHPLKALGMVIFWTGIGMMVSAMMSDGFGGDDDDKNKGDKDESDGSGYYDLPEYVRRNNLCIKVGNQWVKIPLSIEIRALYGMGELAYAAMTGHKYYDSTKELTSDIMSQMSQIMPIDVMEGAGGVNAFVPSSVKPLWELYTNTDWTGKPIYKQTAFNENEPAYQKAYSNTNAKLVDISEWLNEKTGGNAHRKGWLNVNPAALEHIIEGYLGGIATIANQMMKTGGVVMGDREFEWRNTPIASRFMQNSDSRAESRNLKNAYFEYRDDMQKIADEVNGFRRDARNPKLTIEERRDAEAQRNKIVASDDYKFYEITWKGLQKQLDKARDSGDQKTEDALIQKMVESYRDYRMKKNAMRIPNLIKEILNR